MINAGASEFENARGIMAAIRAAQPQLRPPPDLRPSDWAEAGNVKVPVGNAIPGEIRFENAPYQREPLDMTADPECQRITLQWGAQVGKAVCLDTPLPTPDGFRPMRDIKPGDVVFDENGRPCRVTFATEPMLDRACYDVVFDDGSVVRCDGEHLWTVRDGGHKMRGKATNRVLTLQVKDMIPPHERARAKGRNRYAVANTRPVEMPERPLPLDPYIYGLWLGDGIRSDGQITLGRGDESIAEMVRARGYQAIIRYKDARHPDVGYMRVICPDGTPLAAALSRHGLRTKDAVSEIFLFAGISQRRELLAGLMDSDGTVDSRGQVEFISKSEALAAAVFHLAASLGIKPRRRIVSKSCTYRGERREGSYHQVTFKAYPDDDIFRLQRKHDRLANSRSGFSYERRTESRERRIVAINPVASVPVKCIQVDSPNHLYLVGPAFIPTHNTMLALCAQAYRIAQNPTSQIMMQPSQGDLHTWLETKFNPLVEANGTLRGLIAKPRGRDGVNNQRMKSYPGGFIMFSWSGSPKTMRGRSAPFIVCDETDGYDRTQEGHPVGLLWQRAATFGDQRLLLEISTPTIKGTSWIESAYLEGDQRRFHVPCPHCGVPQALDWRGVQWDKDADGQSLPETARYVCQAYDAETGEVTCGKPWSDGQRIAAIRQGQWVAKRPFRGHASYHLSELYSCFREMRDIVQSFLEKKAANDLQTFVNVSLAETWEERGEATDPTGLMARAERFAAPVPAGGLVLTAGIDMQEDRLEVETVAWGLGEESWSVSYDVLWGDVLHGDVWEALDDHLASTWLHQSGAHLPISAACLDTGGSAGMTHAAYEYARARSGRRLFAIKGVGEWGRPIVSSPSRKSSGQRARKVDLFTIGTNDAKVVVMRRLGVEQPGPGYCHFPVERGPDYFEGLTAEQLITRYQRGFPVREWHKRRPRNEPFDCRVYALAALKILNPNMVRAAKRLAVPDEVEAPPVDDQLIEARPVAQEMPPEDRQPPQGKDGAKKIGKRRRSKGGWVQGWK